MESLMSESGEVAHGNLRRQRLTTLTISGILLSLLFKQAKDKPSIWTMSRLAGTNMTTQTSTGRHTLELGGTMTSRQA
jgi:hypothetical protein